MLPLDGITSNVWEASIYWYSATTNFAQSYFLTVATLKSNGLFKVTFLKSFDGKNLDDSLFQFLTFKAQEIMR